MSRLSISFSFLVYCHLRCSLDGNTRQSLGEEGVDTKGNIMLLDLLQRFSSRTKMLEVWRDSVIIPIFKEQGDIQDCGNYRGITMILSYLEDLVKNNRQNIEGGDKHKRRAVRFHAGQRDNWCNIYSECMMEKHRQMQKELEVFEGTGYVRKVCAPCERHV